MKTPRDTVEIEKIKEKILEGALEIIVNDGFNALTMRHLGKKIGMTAPNIYNYFSNKDEIYITLVIRGFEKLLRELETVYNNFDDPVERIRSLLGTYLSFGMNNISYYDIMFTRPTPKYDDYVGTPHEKLSEIEYKMSMDIAMLAMKALQDALGQDTLITEKDALMRVVEVWSLLHGMITLHNSKIVTYVVPNVEEVYKKLLDELLDRVFYLQRKSN